MVVNSFSGLIKKIASLNFKTYDIRLAAALCVFLSMALWWIPVVGPAVAGYVCGRKTGSMSKGFLVSLVMGTIITFTAWLLAKLILPGGGFPNVSADQAAASMNGFSGLWASYLATFYVPGTFSLAWSQLGVLAVFGLVGGVLSRQLRMETAQLLGTGAVDKAIRSMSRSAELYEINKTLGFKSYEDCMAKQGMMVNENPDTSSSEHRQRSSRKGQTTVQTVTMSSVPVELTSDDGAAEDPFVDILERTDKRKKRI